MKNQSEPKAMPIIIAYLFVMLILPALLTIGLEALMDNGVLPFMDKDQLIMVNAMATYIIMPVISLAYYRDRLSRDIKSAGKIIGLLIPMIFMVYAFSIIGGILVQFIDHTTTTANQTTINNLRNINVYMTAYMSVVAAPIVEETIFRVTMIGQRRKFKGFIALLVSCALFSLIHNFNFSLGAFMTYFLIALPLGGIYLKYRNMAFNILTHAGYNAIALTLSILVQKN